MGIDQAGGENATAAVNHFGVGVRVLEIGRSADHRYPSVTDGDRGVPQNSRFAHLFSFARSRGTGTGDDLGRVNEEKVCQRNGETGEAGSFPVIARDSG
jgi:hypothetical protein